MSRVFQGVRPYSTRRFEVGDFAKHIQGFALGYPYRRISQGKTRSIEPTPGRQIEDEFEYEYDYGNDCETSLYSNSSSYSVYDSRPEPTLDIPQATCNENKILLPLRIIR